MIGWITEIRKKAYLFHNHNLLWNTYFTAPSYFTNKIKSKNSFFISDKI